MAISTTDSGKRLGVGRMKYVLFTTPYCPACPPVKTVLKELEQKGRISGENVDVTQENGYEKAIAFNVSRAPTVIFLDEANHEIGRANNASEVKSIVFDY